MKKKIIFVIAISGLTIFGIVNNHKKKSSGERNEKSSEIFENGYDQLHYFIG